MNTIKLQKITGKSTDELFGIPSHNDNAAYEAQSHARSISNYDEDIISEMRGNLEDAENYLAEAESDIEHIIWALDEWRALAEALWDSLPKDQQQDYIVGALTSEKKEALKKAFNLENLKNL